ncbi:MAG: glutathione S-transferase family protein [Hormoscilla sp. GUM202]|nr:glutathione S-transferase family protein [Hormoscilla sp. GUM202]
MQVDFTYKNIELGKDNKTDWFHQLNPNGTVPVIQHGETVVYESLVINEYLQEVFGSDRMKLYPQNQG